MTRPGQFLLMRVAGACGAPASQDDDPEARRFFQQPIGQEGTAIRRYSVERQLEIYEYGMRHFHPPPIHLSYYIAAAGTPVIAPVVRRLRREPADWMIESYLAVLADLACSQGSRPLEDSTTESIVRAAVGRIKSPIERTRAERALRRMRGDCAPSRIF